MADLPVIFRQAPPFNVSFDFTDFSDGMGYKTIYAGIQSSNDVETVSGGVLSSKPFYSLNCWSASGAKIYNTNGIHMWQDFDTEINKTITINGKGILQIPMGVESRASTYAYTFEPICILKRIRGGVETEIANISGAIAFTTAGLTGGAAKYVLFTLGGDLPKTILAKDDTLRLTVQYFGKSNYSEGAPAYAVIGHDPMNRITDDFDSSEVSFGVGDRTDLIFYMPVEIDV